MIVLYLNSSKNERYAVKVTKNVLSKIQKKEPDDANQIVLKFLDHSKAWQKNQVVNNDQNQLTSVHQC